MKLLVLFTLISLVNVIFSTIRSITTIKCGPWVASIVSALYFSYYNIVLIYTVADFPLWQKCVITGVCNLVGVLIVKIVENKMRKDKLWVFNSTAKENSTTIKTIHDILKNMGISSIYNEIEKDALYTIQIFAHTQKESAMVKSVLENYNIKYHAYETQTC